MLSLRTLSGSRVRLKGTNSEVAEWREIQT